MEPTSQLADKLGYGMNTQEIGIDQDNNIPSDAHELIYGYQEPSKLLGYLVSQNKETSLENILNFSDKRISKERINKLEDYLLAKLPKRDRKKVNSSILYELDEFYLVESEIFNWIRENNLHQKDEII